MNKKIATNIITVFLGVGKTTSILQLLKQKKEKDKFELFFKDKSKKIFKVIQNVNGRDFVWEDR